MFATVSHFQPRERQETNLFMHGPTPVDTSHAHNGKEATVNIALDGSTYPG